MNPFRTGKLVLFQVSYDRDWHYFEIPFYVILGVFGVSERDTKLAATQKPLAKPHFCFNQGCYGAFVMKFNLQVAAIRRKHLGPYPIYEAVFLAVLSAVIG